MSDTIPAPGFNLDALLREQRRRWESRSPIRVEELLERHPWLRERNEALLDLINHEIVLRTEFASPATRAEFLERFPSLHGELMRMFDVQEALAASDSEPRRSGAAPIRREPRLPRPSAAPASVPVAECHSLASKLHGAPQPAIATARFVESLARVVQSAHNRGTICRDLNPENVLLSPGAQPELRTSKPGSPAGASSEIIPSYLAPEQRGDLAKPTAPVVDVYSLGAILYEMITGRPPFRGETALDTLEQVRTLELVHPRRLQPRCPHDLETICVKCLDRDPGQRYATAGELADDLGRFLSNQPIRARPISVWQRFQIWRRRHPALAVLIGTIVALTLLSEGILLYFALRAG
jgi:hypothetical protein